MIFPRAGNEALQSNPRVAQIDITTHASDWLWAAFCVMALSDLIFLGLALSAPLGRRTFYHIPIMLLTTASIAYFCMASDLGAVGIQVEFVRNMLPGFTSQNGSTPTRSIWYVRYIDWTITTPLLLLEILLCTALPLSDIITVIFFDIAMIVTGLVGALVQSQYKWGLYAFGCAFLFYIWYVLIVPGRAAAVAVSPGAGRAFTVSALYLSFLWLLYPIAWGVADGGNVITPTSEMVFYGVLDVLAKPVFCFVHVFLLRGVDHDAFPYLGGAGARTGLGAHGAKQGVTTGGTVE